MKPVVVVATFPDEALAKQTSKKLLEEKLIACVNLIPQVISMYIWEGKLCEESELLAVMKTTEERYAELESAIQTMHSYDVPEVLCFDIDGGLPEYLKWVGEVVRG